MANVLNPEEIAGVIGSLQGWVNNDYLPCVQSMYEMVTTIGPETNAGQQLKDKYVNGIQPDFNNNVQPALDKLVKELMGLEGVAEAWQKVQIDTTASTTDVGEVQSGVFDPAAAI